MLVIAIICFLLSWFGLFWLLSAGSLAMADCQGFSLLSELWRCRQPDIAALVWLCCGVMSVGFCYLAWRRYRQLGKEI